MRLTTKSLRKKTKQTLCFYCMVTAQTGSQGVKSDRCNDWFTKMLPWVSVNVTR